MSIRGICAGRNFERAQLAVFQLKLALVAGIFRQFPVRRLRDFDAVGIDSGQINPNIRPDRGQTRWAEDRDIGVIVEFLAGGVGQFSKFIAGLFDEKRVAALGDFGAFPKIIVTGNCEPVALLDPQLGVRFEVGIEDNDLERLDGFFFDARLEIHFLTVGKSGADGSFFGDERPKSEGAGGDEYFVGQFHFLKN